MTAPIKLPPLPSPFGIIDPVFKRENLFYDLKDLQDYAMAYARAAIEPYAKRIAELEAARIAYASEFPMNDDGEPDVERIHENIRKLKADLQAMDDLISKYQEKVRALEADNHTLVAETDELKRRGEPVAHRWRKPIVDDNGKTRGYTDWIYTEQKEFLAWWPHEPLYTTPQPQQIPEGLVEILREASEIIAAIPTGSEPENMRFPIVDELAGFAAMLEAAPEPKGNT